MPGTANYVLLLAVQVDPQCVVCVARGNVPVAQIRFPEGRRKRRTANAEWRDSNPHFVPFKGTASTDWATPASRGEPATYRGAGCADPPRRWPPSAIPAGARVQSATASFVPHGPSELYREEPRCDVGGDSATTHSGRWPADPLGSPNDRYRKCSGLRRRADLEPPNNGFAVRCLTTWLRHATSLDRRKAGAGNGIRTRDPDLGKVVLYH